MFRLSILQRYRFHFLTLFADKWALAKKGRPGRHQPGLGEPDGLAR
jgi:hypothetical protein